MFQWLTVGEVPLLGLPLQLLQQQVRQLIQSQHRQSERRFQLAYDLAALSAKDPQVTWLK